MGRKSRKQQARNKNRAQQQQKTQALPAAPLPEPPALNQEQPPVKEGDRNTKDERDVPPSRATVDWHLWFTAVVAFAAIIQAWTSYLQWDATHKQYESMERQLKLTETDQRPWLSFEVPKMHPLAEDEPFRGAVTIENSGQTPATVVMNEFFFVLRPRATIEKLTSAGRRSQLELNIDVEKEIAGARRDNIMVGATMMTPGVTATYSLSALEPYTKDEIELLKAGALVVAIIPYVRYLDAAGRSHETWACFVYDHVSKKTRPHPKYGHMD